MVKRIALFLDGTWNKPQANNQENTNVYRLWEATAGGEGKR